MKKLGEKMQPALQKLQSVLPMNRLVPIAGAAAAVILLIVVISMNTATSKMRRKVVAETAHYRVTAAVFSVCFRQYADSYLAAAEAEGSGNIYDPKIPLTEQEYSNGETWYDMFFDNTLSRVKNDLRVCEAARAADYELDSAQLEACENRVRTDDLSRYPKGIRESDLLEAAKISALAEAYRQQVRDRITVSEEEIDQYYAEHGIEYYTASVLSYTFQWDAERVLAGDPAEQEAALRAAEGLAACSNQQDFTEYVYRYLTDQKKLDRSEAEQIAADLVTTGFVQSYPADVRTWLESGAQRGDTVALGKTGQCTKTVYMLRDVPTPDESKTVDIRVIELGAAGFGSAEEAAEFALELQNEVTAAGGTSEAFAERALEYSEDTASYANGGLISGYSAVRTDYGDEIAAWSFDRVRQHGDMTVAVLPDSAVLVYFECANEDTGWKNQVREDIYQNKLSGFTQECARYEVEITEQNYKYIKAS